MKKIKVVGRYRGFFMDLFEKKINNFEFDYSLEDKFEVPTRTKKMLLKIFNSKILDFLGLFTSYSAPKNNFGYLFSYNRFIDNANEDYVVYLENPTALVNYSTTKMKSFIGKKRSNKFLSDKQLNKIVCMSKICENGFKYYYGESYSDKVIQIYPLINDLKEEQRDESLNVMSDNVRILFVGATFIGKGGLELVEIIKHFDNKNTNVFFDIITKISEIPEEVLFYLMNNTKVKLNDFILSKDELNVKYQQADIFLLPTKFESFGLVFLEAMKNACALIGPDLYSIPEIIRDGVNGYLYRPQINSWSAEGILLEKEFNKIDSSACDCQLVDILVTKITYLLDNLDDLAEMKKNSLEISQNENFGEKNILRRWEEIIH